MKRLIPTVPVVLILAVGGIMVLTGITSGKDGQYREEKISFEDAIIINELKMTSDVPPAEAPEEQEAEASEAPSRDFNINELKKKDNRWHMSRYRIRKDDSIWNIARRFHVDHRLIIRANNLKKANSIRPGRVLNIPNRLGAFYTVKRGDTLIEIGHKFDTPYRKIIEHNSIRPRKLKVGDKLFIPDAAELPRNRKSSYSNQEKKQPSRNYTIRKKRATVVKKAVPHRNVTKHTSNKVTRRPRFAWPMKGKITSGFGTRTDPFSGKKAFHCGIDISAVSGTPVKASAPGRVIYSGWKSSYGKVVVLRHQGGYITVYAHNSRNLVKVNSKVKEGQLIAYSGNTGASTGGHLHFEIRKYVTPLNPFRMLPRL